MFGRRLVSSFATERSIKWATYLNIGPMCNMKAICHRLRLVWTKYESYLYILHLFVFRFYCQVNPMGSCRAWSVYLTTFLLGKWLTSNVHIVSLETDTCPSCISGRERMTIESISWSNRYEIMLLTQWGSNL